MTTTELLLVAAALLAGFIDAIAGGGGLVLLPALSLVVGAGPTAIGTNKPAAVAMAAIALIVYARRGHLDWRLSGMFALMLGIGALIGSRLALLIPLDVFPWLLALTCPVLLYVVWQKDLWLPHEVDQSRGRPQPFAPAVLISGLASGVYDGAFGPGAGTFMFLCLLFFAHLPLLTALAAAKLANTVSAAVALGSYAESGHVDWRLGGIAVVGALVGGYLGARQASVKAALIVRPTLVVVVVLLVLRIVLDEVSPGADSADHFYRTTRLIAALLIATLVPFFIDRYARRSSRVNH
ncbi:MAG: sulfite exporter TauE/SafE family protein [Gemmatimonadaceae bacterium]